MPSARLIPADRLVALPDGITRRAGRGDDAQGHDRAVPAAADLSRSQPGQTILFHAAAGGVGLIACQWAKHLGATVIGTVGSDEKAELARAHGCDHPIRYDREDFVARVREITGGKGVPVVYDSVGQATFERSLDCLAPLGMLVSFGQSSGKIPPFDTAVLGQKGSLFLTRPTLMTYTAARADLLRGGKRAVRRGQQRRGQDRDQPALSRCATRPRRIAPSRAARPPARRCCCRRPRRHGPGHHGLRESTAWRAADAPPRAAAAARPAVARPRPAQLLGRRRRTLDHPRRTAAGARRWRCAAPPSAA